MRKTSEWEMAQKSECASWLISDEFMRKEKISRETIRYPKLRKEMGLDLLDTRDMNVVEIGGGPVGVIADLPARTKIIVDPLSDEYRTMFPCPYHIVGKGENLVDLIKISVKLIVICNALDHCESPIKVIDNCYKLLPAGGFLAVHNCINLASIHKHEAHKTNLDESWFHDMLDYDFEFVHEESWSKTGLRYGWVKNPYDGRVGQPAISFLARKVTGYGK